MTQSTNLVSLTVFFISFSASTHASNSGKLTLINSEIYGVSFLLPPTWGYSCGIASGIALNKANSNTMLTITRYTDKDVTNIIRHVLPESTTVPNDISDRELLEKAIHVYQNATSEGGNLTFKFSVKNFTILILNKQFFLIKLTEGDQYVKSEIDRIIDSIMLTK